MSLFGLLILFLDVLVLVDIVQSGKSTTWTILWILLVLLLPVIGMVCYLLLGKNTNIL